MTPVSRKDHGQSKSILNNILEKVGDTPLVRLNKIPQKEGLACEFVVKCEFFNAGGSIKDRIGVRMIEEAERLDLLHRNPPTTIIEATSGNTGIVLAMAGAIKGYPVAICIPEKMSKEKINTMKALGAKIYQTPTEVASTHPQSHISLSKKLYNELHPNAYIPDQYSNPANPNVHYEKTAMEIWNDCNGRIDVVVMGAGTGGTITGVGKHLKELDPNIIIVGVDPVGSILAKNLDDHDDNRPYLVEGIGYDFVPGVLDPSIADKWEKVEDRESFRMARRLIKEEAILCGGSSGAAMSAAIKVAKELKLGSDKRIVIILPDSVRNYMSKFLNDDWMLINGFMDPVEFQKEGMINYPLSRGHIFKHHPVPLLDIKDSAEKLKSLKCNPYVAITSAGEMVGFIEMKKFAIKLIKDGPVAYTQDLCRHMEKEFKLLSKDALTTDILTFTTTGYPVFIESDNSTPSTLSSNRNGNNQEENAVKSICLVDPIDLVI